MNKKNYIWKAVREKKNFQTIYTLNYLLNIMTNLNIYCLSLKYYQIIDKLPSYIKPLGLGNEEYPKHWLTE